MNTAKLRSKRVVLPAIAAAALLAVGGPVWAATASDDPQGSERERVATAATEAVGGTVVDVETSDDRGEAYEVEVRTDKGTEIEVALDTDLKVVDQKTEDGDEDRGENGTEDRALHGTERTSVEKASLAAVGGGTVLHAEASDDGDEAFEVEVRDKDNTQWEIELDADYTVLNKSVDD